MALVLVLSALALLSFLVLLVLTMTRNEDRASKASADVIEVRTLADLPAQLVISQIRRATSNLGSGFTWASQPGMIRVYASGATDKAGRAGLYEAYKLYSSPQLVVRGSDFSALAEQALFKDWAASPALFTDLNEPVPLRPILRSGGGTVDPAEARPKMVYPILDPAALKLVDGFELDGSAPGATETQPLPMPALWLYVLRNGRVISPAGGGENSASFPADEISETNPIVARIAFWTDDESCKINLNAASEPAPWDEPRANSKMDRAYAAYQPAQNEFHRQPGHPAFTALSPVFQAFGRDASSAATANAFSPVPDPVGITGAASPGQNADADAEKFRDYVESNHRPLPRTLDGTSSDNRDRSSLHGTQPPAEKVRVKGERLFSTIDELLFDTNRKPMKVSGDGLSTAQTLTEDDISKARFFLTTNNSAPETNPFNRPKISLWPVQEETDLRSKTDRRMALAASVSGKEFFWQRKSAWESNASPGSSQSTSDDASIKRNLELLGYMQDLAALSMPGYGGSLKTKYDGGEVAGTLSNTEQIITSMFDMLRWGVNVENTDETATTGERYHYLPPSRQGDGSKPVGEYSAVPMILGNGSTQVRGFGRFPTITEVALVFVATDGEKKGNAYVDQKNSRGELGADGFVDKTKKIRVFVIVEPFCPVVGLPAATPAFRYRIKGLSKLGIQESPADFFTDADDEKVNVCSSMGTSGAKRVLEGTTGFNGLASQFLKSNGEAKTISGGTEDETFPFVSAEVAFSNGRKEEDTMTLTGEPLTVEIFSVFGSTNADDAIQTLKIPLPGQCKIPVPWLPTNPVESAEERIAKRFVMSDARLPLIQNGDVVRSVEADPSLAWKGDLRLLAAMGTRGNPPVTYRGDPQTNGDESLWVFPSMQDLEGRFASTDIGDRAMHSLRSGAYLEDQYGKADAESILNSPVVARMQSTAETAAPLLPGLAYPRSAFPAVVSMPRKSGQVFAGAVNADGRLGDWNNAPGLMEDGPYIGKPDFGNTINEATAGMALNSAVGGYYQRGGDFVPDSKGLNSAPLRQISSAIVFGSLPTGAHSREEGGTARPWQTLLFCPNPLSRETEAGAEDGIAPADHFGFLSPPDHTWLEFFWMPVTDPYPMSVGFSTVGKVNMNFQIMPFTYIRRATAMHAALRGVRVTAFPSSAASEEAMLAGKHFKDPKSVTRDEFRYPVNATATLKGFDEERFKKGDVFRSASEICEMFLVPKRFGEPDTTGGAVAASAHEYGGAKPTTELAHTKMVGWWNGKPKSESATDAFEVTGDNTREAPYAQLYPRLCTRSNVYQVHYRVQLIRKSRSTALEVVDLNKDQVTAEYRGSTTVERYVDPNDKDIPDFAALAGSAQALDDFYRYRIVSRQPFTP